MVIKNKSEVFSEIHYIYLGIVLLWSDEFNDVKSYQFPIAKMSAYNCSFSYCNNFFNGMFLFNSLL